MSPQLGRHIHLIEPTGRGGIFQHCSELASILARNGDQVTLHSSYPIMKRRRPTSAYAHALLGIDLQLGGQDELARPPACY